MSKEPEELKEFDVSETDSEADEMTEPSNSEIIGTQEEAKLMEQFEESDGSGTKVTEDPESSEGSSDETDAEETDTAEESAEEPESAPLNDKILAIKSAIQQEETKLEIADKVRKYKNVMENGDQPVDDASARTAEPSEPVPVKKKSKKMIS